MSNATIAKRIAYDVHHRQDGRPSVSVMGEIVQIQTILEAPETFLVKVFEERPTVARWHGPKANVPGETYLRRVHPLRPNMRDEEVINAFEQLTTAVTIKPDQPTHVAMISYLSPQEQVVTELGLHRTWRLIELLRLVPPTVPVGELLPLLPVSETFSFRDALLFVHRARVWRPTT